MISRKDRHFQIIKRVNDNAYKIDLLGEYNVSATFNVSDIYLFDVGDDSRTNSFEERGNDTIQATPRDLLEILGGLVTKFRTKRFKEALNGLHQDICAKVDFKKILSNEVQVLINLIHVQDGFVGRHSDITKRLK
jgi:hypothetical protein